MWTFCSSYLIVSYCNFRPEANRRMAHREAGAIHCWSAEQKLYFTVLGFSFNRGNLLRVPTPSDCRTSSSWWSMCGSTRNETNAKALARFLPTLWCRSKGYVSTELFLVSLICILLFLTSKTIHPTRMQDSKGGCPASEQHVPFEVTPYPSEETPSSQAVAYKQCSHLPQHCTAPAATPSLHPLQMGRGLLSVTEEIGKPKRRQKPTLNWQIYH